MTNAALRGKPDAGNPHVRFDEGEVALAATPRRGSLLYSALTIRELPEETMRTLKARASYNHRSLNGEILYLFDYIASFGAKFSFTISRPEDPSVTSRRDAVLALAGQWKDDRSDEEIMQDIESTRTFGREVDL